MRYPLLSTTIETISAAQTSHVVLAPEHVEKIVTDTRLLAALRLMDWGKATNNGDLWTRGCWMLAKEMTGSWQAAGRLMVARWKL